MLGISLGLTERWPASIGSNPPAIDGGSDLVGSVTEVGTGEAGDSLDSGTVIVDDADDTAWTFAGSDDGTFGSFTIDPSTGVWEYTLDNDLPAVEALTTGETEVDVFPVTVTDSDGLTTSTNVTISVHGADDTPPYEANAAHFAAGASLDLATFAGASDSNFVSWSFWINRATYSGQYVAIFVEVVNNIYHIDWGTSGDDQAIGSYYDAVGQTAVHGASIGTPDLNDGNWHHVCGSVRGNPAAMHFFVDGVNRQVFVQNNMGSNNINFDSNGMVIHGAQGGSPASDLAEIWFTNEYIDFSVQANREKFRGANGKPVDLGADGSTPTGNQPLVYLNEPAATFHQNKGSGGDFTPTGTITDAATSPSD